MEEKIPSPGRYKLVLPNPGDPLGPDRAVGLRRERVRFDKLQRPSIRFRAFQVVRLRRPAPAGLGKENLVSQSVGTKVRGSILRPAKLCILTLDMAATSAHTEVDPICWTVGGPV